jgi:hypothetical protein
VAVSPYCQTAGLPLHIALIWRPRRSVMPEASRGSQSNRKTGVQTPLVRATISQTGFSVSGYPGQLAHAPAGRKHSRLSTERSHQCIPPKFQIISGKSSFWLISPRSQNKRSYHFSRNVRRAPIDDRATGPAPAVFSGLDTDAGQGRSSACYSLQSASLEVPLAYGFGCSAEVAAVAFAAATFAPSSTTFFHLLVFRYAFTFSGEIRQYSSDTDSGTWRAA